MSPGEYVTELNQASFTHSSACDSSIYQPWTPSTHWFIYPLPHYRLLLQKLQILLHTEKNQLMVRHSGTEAIFSSSTMMLASCPPDCQWVDFRGPSSYRSSRNRGWLSETIWNTCRQNSSNHHSVLLQTGRGIGGGTSGPYTCLSSESEGSSSSVWMGWSCDSITFLWS